MKSVQIHRKKAERVSPRSRAFPDREQFIDWVNQLRERVEVRLEELLPPTDFTPSQLRDVVGYGLLSPGKRIRPLLALMSTVHFGGDEVDALEFACAIEMVHSASLMLDDLPSMDNAVLRRRRRTAHVAYGEDLATLGAIALLNHAFAITLRAPLPPNEVKLQLSEILTEAVGFDGLVAGQTRDLKERNSSNGELHDINRQKTGALFIASVDGGALISGASEDVRAEARQFAGHLGLAYQILDDILDEVSNEAELGKDVAQDHKKNTLPQAVGVHSAQADLEAKLSQAVNSLSSPFDRGPLIEIAKLCFEGPRALPALYRGSE